MKQKNALLSNLKILGIPLFLILISIFFALNLNRFDADSEILSIGITIDLVITIPIIYFVLIRKRRISKLTVMPFFVGGLILATFFIPAANQSTLDLIKTWLLPLVEISVFTLIFLKMRNLRKRYKAGKSSNLDFYTALKQSALSIFSEKLAYAFATEIGLIYYGFFTWKKPSYQTNQFTYHKESGIQGILGVILFVALVELFSVHLLIHEAYPILTWVLTILSAYGVIQIIGLIKSIPRTPHFIDDNTLVLRMGIFQETQIPFELIESIELTTLDYPKEDKSFQKITLFDHNCIVHLKAQGTLHGLFGSKKSYNHIVLSVDNKHGFKTSIEKRYLGHEI